MGLKDLFQSQKTIRELRSEVASLTRQQEQACRRLESSEETAANVKKEVERQEQNRACDMELERARIERELFKVLQPLLLSLPTARETIRKNPELLARDMIGMFRPVEDFAEALGLSVIGEVGEEIPYDSVRHDSVNALEPGAPVRIVTVGYCRGEEIWIKARVKEL